MGFGCEAIYKHGKDNIAAEALSRRDEEVAMDRLWAKLLENIILAPLIVCFLTIPNSDNHYLWRDSLLWNKGRLVVLALNELRTLIL